MEADKVTLSELKQARKNCQEVVQDILDLPTSDGWQVCDVQDNLALVHYDYDFGHSAVQKTEIRQYEHLRGTIVDMTAKRTLAVSFGHTPTVVCDRLIKRKNNKISLKDAAGMTYEYNLKNLVIRRVFEGVVFRVFWYDSKLYLSTHKKINAEKSFWGSSIKFTEMYHQAGGPKAEELFDTTKKYGSHCYFFMVVHPDLLIATRQRVDEPYIVLLEKFPIDLKGLPDSEIDFSDRKIKTSSELSAVVEKSFCHAPEDLSIYEANDFLSRGFFLNPSPCKDRRLWNGEAVILYNKEQGKISQVLEVHSTAYDWRRKLRSNNPNVEMQYYKLLENICVAKGKKIVAHELEKLFCLIKIPEDSENCYFKIEGLLDSFTVYDKDKNANYNCCKDRLYLESMIWCNYFYSLPLSQQKAACDAFTNYQEGKKRLIKFLMLNAECENGIDLQPNLIKGRKIIRAVQLTKLVRELYKKGSDDDQIRKSIENLLTKEDPCSLYTLFKFINDFNARKKYDQYFDLAHKKDDTLPLENAEDEQKYQETLKKLSELKF